MTGLSIAIQHAPHFTDRRQWVQAMQQQLRTESPEVPVTIAEDTRREGCWPTYRRTLEAAGDVSHHVSVQDDVGLCRDFVRSVETVVKIRPGTVIGLYSHAVEVWRARERGDSWLKIAVPSVAVVWPRHLIDEFLAWEARHIDPALPDDNIRVGLWLYKTGRATFATVPSLAEHLGWNASTGGWNRPDKRATWFIGSDRSAIEIDWTKGLDSPFGQNYHFEPVWWNHYRE